MESIEVPWKKAFDEIGTRVMEEAASVRGVKHSVQARHDEHESRLEQVISTFVA